MVLCKLKFNDNLKSKIIYTYKFNNSIIYIDNSTKRRLLSLAGKKINCVLVLFDFKDLFINQTN